MVYGVADPGVFAHDFIQRRLRAFYSGFVFGTAFARRASFTAATATAIKTLRSTPPYITKTIQGLPDSTFRSPPGRRLGLRTCDVVLLRAITPSHSLLGTKAGAVARGCP